MSAASASARANLPSRRARPCARICLCWSTPNVRATIILARLIDSPPTRSSDRCSPTSPRRSYGLDQTRPGLADASLARRPPCRAPIPSSIHGARIRPARTMIAFAMLWFTCNLSSSRAFTGPLFCGEGAAVSQRLRPELCIVPMAVILLHVADPRFRSRVISMRVPLLMYGMPMGPAAVGTTGRAGAGFSGHRRAVQPGPHRFRR